MAFNKSERPEGAARRRPGRRRKVCVFCGKDNVFGSPSMIPIFFVTTKIRFCIFFQSNIQMVALNK